MKVWIAKDLSGFVNIFKTRPEKSEKRYWWENRSDIIQSNVDSSLVKFLGIDISWKDDESVEVELNVK